MTARAVKGNGAPGPDKAGLEKLPKAKLIAMILEQREDMRIRLEEKDKRITELSEQLAKMQGEIDQEKAGQKIKDITLTLTKSDPFMLTKIDPLLARANNPAGDINVRTTSESGSTPWVCLNRHSPLVFVGYGDFGGSRG